MPYDWKISFGVRNGLCLSVSEHKYLSVPIEPYNIKVLRTAVRRVIVAASYNRQDLRSWIKMNAGSRSVPVVFDLLDNGRMPRLQLKHLNASNYCATAAAVPPL